MEHSKEYVGAFTAIDLAVKHSHKRFITHHMSRPTQRKSTTGKCVGSDEDFPVAILLLARVGNDVSASNELETIVER